jgi:hypothetical protein
MTATSDTPQPRSPTSSSTRTTKRDLFPADFVLSLHRPPGYMGVQEFPPEPATVLSVSAKVVGAWDVDPVHSYGWRRRGVGLDWMENPCPSKGFRPHSFPFSLITSSSVDFSTL